MKVVKGADQAICLAPFMTFISAVVSLIVQEEIRGIY